MLFRSVFSRPISADWEVSEEVEVFSASFALTNGSPNLYLDTYRTDVDINQLISGTGIPTGTLVQAITSSNIKTLGAITGGSLYTNGSYPGVTLTGGNGNGATADIVVAGGVESMSRSALLVARPGKGQQPDFSDCRDSMVTDGLTDCGIGLHMGQTAELLASEFRISRESQDLWALRSQRLAGQASTAGIFQAELAEACGLSSDEHPRPHLTLGDLTGLAPVFESTGTVTAGNSSGLNDGAAMLLLASEEAVRRNDWPVLCEWVDGVSVGCNPRQMGLGPVYATEQLLQRTGTSLDDVDQLEINEAFAAQTLACVQRLGLRWTAEAEAEPAESGFVGTADRKSTRLNSSHT